MMVLWAKIKIAYLVNWLTMIEIVSNPENNGSFLMKSIKMEFYSHLGIRSYLRDP